VTNERSIQAVLDELKMRLKKELGQNGSMSACLLARFH
jgi:hypothetical protein